MSLKTLHSDCFFSFGYQASLLKRGLKPFARCETIDAKENERDISLLFYILLCDDRYFESVCVGGRSSLLFLAEPVQKKNFSLFKLPLENCTCICVPIDIFFSSLRRREN